MLAITVGEAKQAIRDRTFIKMIYVEISKGKLAPDNKLSKLEFITFSRHFVTKMSEYEASELFSFLIRKERTGPEFETASQYSIPTQNERLDLQVLDAYFEKWFKEEDSLNAFTNAKLTQQRFKEFKLKLEVWNKQ